VVAFVGTLLTIGFGFAQFAPVGRAQPIKLGDDAAKAAAIQDFTNRFGPGDYSLPTYASVGLGLMITLAFLLFLVGLFIPLFYRDWIIRSRVPLYLLLLAVPAPFIAAVMGWLFREGGRQPWAAYGLLPVRDAMTPGASPLASFIVFTTVLVGLAVTDWFLIARAAHRGPVAPREDALTPLA
jgi:cytochrome d ubiquinol oxidase subunit I